MGEKHVGEKHESLVEGFFSGLLTFHLFVLI